jgi:hypothetical protein
MRAGIDHRIRTTVAILLALTITECVAKPVYRCTTDDACVSSDGTRGYCDKSGVCEFTSVGGSSSVGGSLSVGGSSSVGGGETADCNVDLTLTCFPCTPTNSQQIANACTSATCVPFDDATRLTNLTADGGLPPLPAAH